MTLYETLAVHAPKDIPGWFQHKQRQRPRFSEPNIPDPHDIETVRQWRTDLRDEGIDLPDHLQHIQKAYEEYGKECREWDRQDRIDRMAQWPWFYAYAVLSADNRMLDP